MLQQQNIIMKIHNIDRDLTIKMMIINNNILDLVLKVLILLKST